MVDRLPTYVNLFAFTFVCTGGFAPSAFAHDAPAYEAPARRTTDVEACATELTFAPLTLAHARENAVARNEKHRSVVAPVDFFDLPGQARVEQIEEWRAPRALREVFGRGVAFVAAPTPTSADPVSIGLIEEQNSFVTHVSTEWAGRTRSTAAYVSLPGAKIRSAGDYLIGPEHKVVLFHLHGGGTPTATGKNGVSIGIKMAARGFPTVGIDLPGHGIGTKNIFGLETTEQQVDYILKVLAQLVHPSVKVVLSGHSWGGQFAAYMHRHSDEPKYHQIVEFISLSPPVDVSNSGDLRAKAEFESDWHRRMYAGEYDQEIAATDLDFLRNMLKHSKESEIGQVFLAATDSQYATPRLSPERQAKLKKNTVAIGSRDMLFVGREAAYREAWGNLIAPSRYLEIGRGQTFEGPRDTGHNLFDVFDTDPQTGKHRHLIYNLIAETLAAHAQQPEPVKLKGLPSLIAGIHAHFPNLTTSPISTVAPAGIQKRLNILRAYVKNYEDISALEEADRKSAESSVVRAYGELMALEQTATYYANSIGFRVSLNDEVQNVEVNSAEIEHLAERKRAFDSYERDLTRLRDDSAKTTARDEKAAASDLAKRLGLNPNQDFERAREELSFPELTIERRRRLEAFVDTARAIEAELKDAGDPAFATAIENLSATYAPTLNAMGLTISTYESGLSGFGKQKNLNKVQNQQRIELANLSKEVAAAVKARDARTQAQLAKRLEGPMRDLNLTDPRLARREVDAERSPERTRALRQFVDEYESVREAVRTAGLAQLNEKIDRVARPAGLGVDDSFAAMKQAHDRLMNLTHAPEGAGLEDLVAKIVAKRAAFQAVLKGSAPGELSLDQLTKHVDALRAERTKAIGKWTANWGQNLFSSHQVTEESNRLAQLEITYKLKYAEYSAAAAERYLELMMAGRWNVDEIHHMPPALRAQFIAYMNARRDVVRERGQIEPTRVAEAQAGNLEPRADLDPRDAHAATKLTLETVELARLIWGPSYVHGRREEDDSLSSQVARNEKILEERRRNLSILNREVDELRAQYVTRMREKGHVVPVDILRVRIKDYLNSEMSLDDLLTEMDREPRLYQAFANMNRTWDGLTKQLRSMHNRAPDASY